MRVLYVILRLLTALGSLLDLPYGGVLERVLLTHVGELVAHLLTLGALHDNFVTLKVRLCVYVVSLVLPAHDYPGAVSALPQVVAALLQLGGLRDAHPLAAPQRPLILVL